MTIIRQYDPASDYAALRICFIELQSWERDFEPGLPVPEVVADTYLAEVFKSCAESDGRIFLAERDGTVVGFVCVLSKVLSSSDDGLDPFAYISDLAVRAAHRGSGVGRLNPSRAHAGLKS